MLAEWNMLTNEVGGSSSISDEDPSDVQCVGVFDLNACLSTPLLECT